MISLGLTSVLLFLVQRYNNEKLERLATSVKGSALLDKAFQDCKTIRNNFKAVRCFNGCWNFALSLWDYFWTLKMGLNYLSSGDPIWGVVTLIIPFLPGIEW